MRKSVVNHGEVLEICRPMGLGSVERLFQCFKPLLPGRIDFMRFKGLPKNGYQSLEETCQELCPGIVTSCEMRWSVAAFVWETLMCLYWQVSAVWSWRRQKEEEINLQICQEWMLPGRYQVFMLLIFYRRRAESVWNVLSVAISFWMNEVAAGGLDVGVWGRVWSDCFVDITFGGVETGWYAGLALTNGSSQIQSWR